MVFLIDLSLLKEFSKKKISFEDFHNSIWTRLSRSSGSWLMLYSALVWNVPTKIGHILGKWIVSKFRDFLDKMTLKLKYVITIFCDMAKKTNVNFWLKLAWILELKFKSKTDCVILSNTYSNSFCIVLWIISSIFRVTVNIFIRSSK